MKKYAKITGFCSTQNDDYSISVEYLNASTLQEKCHIKGRFRCEYNIYGDKCSLAEECPLFASAPESFQG